MSFDAGRSETSVFPMELRASVSGNTHTLEGLCVPYGRTSRKTNHPYGERFIAAAMADAPAHVDKIRLTDLHPANASTGRRPVGVATLLRDTPEGLWGAFRFYATPEGRGAWENVSEGTYGGLSVGFYAVAERSGTDGVREVVRAQLHHVALVDEPAYEEARVLAVRAARPDVAALLAVTYDLADFPDPPDLAKVVFARS